MKKWIWAKGKKENFLILFLIGILLLVIAWPTQSVKNGEKKTGYRLSDNNCDMVNTKDAGKAEPQADSYDPFSYAEKLAETTENLLTSMEGVGKTQVMITLKNSTRQVVEKDTQNELQSSTEVDQGGSKNTMNRVEKHTTIYENADEEPFVSQVVYPEIEGVVVCAEGGGHDEIKKNITEAVQVLFGIDVHKIKVIKMSSR